MLPTTLRLIVTGFNQNLDGTVQLLATCPRVPGTLSLPITQQDKGNLAVGDEIVVVMHDPDDGQPLSDVADLDQAQQIKELLADVELLTASLEAANLNITGLNVIVTEKDRDAAELRAKVLELQASIDSANAALDAATTPAPVVAPVADPILTDPAPVDSVPVAP